MVRMRTLSVMALAFTCTAFGLPAAAQDVRLPPEPNVQRIVLEDDAVRIEELKVRGQTQRVTVKPRHATAYEIVPAAGGRDPSLNRAGQQPGAGGQRVWHLLSF
jgi:hypothetical protein